MWNRALRWLIAEAFLWTASLFVWFPARHLLRLLSRRAEPFLCVTVDRSACAALEDNIVLLKTVSRTQLWPVFPFANQC